MSIYLKSKQYAEELQQILSLDVQGLLKNKSIAITGARGLIGSEFIDVVMYGNIQYELNCKIYAIVRNLDAAQIRFSEYSNMDSLQFIQADINQDEIEIAGDIDYCIHAASNTHPIYYATKPIETILTNTVGTNNVLKFASGHHCKRFLFLSSVEIYGENRGDVDAFNEAYLGYINCNTLRAGYPEGKRLGETLCQAYSKEKGLDCIVPRVSRCYGPGLLEEDSKALSQFLKNGIRHEDIVLKSNGQQYYSYVYVADVISALLFLLEHGRCGEAYNITGKCSDIKLSDLAQLIASYANTVVKYEIPEQTEKEGYSTATKALLNIDKIQKLGWKPQYTIEEGIHRTLEMKEK